MKNVNEFLSKKHDYIVEEYQYKNTTESEIAKVLGVSASAVCRYRHAHGITRLHKNDEWLREQFALGISDTEIAKKINCSTRPIMEGFIRLGLREPKKKRELVVNDNFFSSYNRHSCYWAGFILADGHIEAYTGYGRNVPNYKLKIFLSATDKEHLEKFNKKLSKQNMIKEQTTTLNVTGKSYDMVVFRTSRKQLCLDLINKFEIPHTNKSMKEFISDKIPKEFLKDFIRGYFDGDGSVSNVKHNTRVCILGSETICNQIKGIISKEYGREIGYVTADDKGKTTVYKYNIDRQKDIILFYLFIYDSRSHVYLKRKKDIFKKIFNKI